MEKKKQDFVQQFVFGIKEEMGSPTDFMVRWHKVGKEQIAVCFLKDIVKHDFVSEFVIKPLVLEKEFLGLEHFRQNIAQSSICMVKNKSEAITFLLSGFCVMACSEDKILVFDTTVFPRRAPSEPPTSAVLKGPRNGFVDDLVSNMSLLRKNLKTKNLHYKEFFVGTHTQTRVTVNYIHGVADSKIVKSICKKIESIKIDGVIDSYYIAEFLTEKPLSLFSQVGTCEKPDIACARMLEGRVCILVDNTPIALTLPFVLLEDLQSSNDYYQNYVFSSFIRFVRLFGIMLATIAPGAYLAFRLYHYKLIPFKFLVTISNSTQGLPFTPFFELLFILIMFELLYEVSLRLPQYLGLATSIVGALILGDTGVSAGLISPPAVMIVALSIISIYTMPDQRGQLSILRFVFAIVGAMFGVIGIVFAVLIVISELCKLESFGSAYLAPFAPYSKKDQKDGIVKLPLCKQNKLPKSIANKTEKRITKKED